MIVVISDLHLQHTACDAVRWAASDRVLETRIERNVGAPALALLVAEIVANARRTAAKEVHLVLAGDIFELHRTPLWLLGGDAVRPTLTPAGGSARLERKVLGILDAVQADNQGFFDALRRFATTGRAVHRDQEIELRNVSIRVHYVPGNHDRLASVWPSTRRRVRDLLQVSVAPGEDPGAPFPHTCEWSRGRGYAVRVRHGHEYDRANFSARFDPKSPPPPEAYQRPTFGDFVTVDVATRLAVAFRAHHARELRVAGADGDPYRRVYAALTEFDDLRPQTMLVRYLLDAVSANEETAYSMLQPVLLDAFETAAADAFFVSEARQLGLGQYFEGPLAAGIRFALRNLSGATIARLVSLVEALQGDATDGGPAAAAMNEPGLRAGDVNVIVAGHTHEPDHVAIPGQRADGTALGEAAYYLDSGTWRTRIDSGRGGTFGRLRAYTMVFCYHNDEVHLEQDERRFETWTGHLHSEEYGPVFGDDVTPRRRPPLQTVRFVECRILHLGEGHGREGAVLALRFGVDADGHAAELGAIHEGAVLPFAPYHAVSVDPALHGEVWCVGTETVRGRSLFARDDPMPWALDLLPRVQQGDAPAAFAPGRRELLAADNRGNAYMLVLDVI